MLDILCHTVSKKTVLSIFLLLMISDLKQLVILTSKTAISTKENHLYKTIAETNFSH